MGYVDMRRTGIVECCCCIESIGTSVAEHQIARSNVGHIDYSPEGIVTVTGITGITCFSGCNCSIEHASIVEQGRAGGCDLRIEGRRWSKYQ